MSAPLELPPPQPGETFPQYVIRVQCHQGRHDLSIDRLGRHFEEQTRDYYALADRLIYRGAAT